MTCKHNMGVVYQEGKRRCKMCMVDLPCKHKWEIVEIWRDVEYEKYVGEPRYTYKNMDTKEGRLKFTATKYLIITSVCTEYKCNKFKEEYYERISNE